MPSLASPLWTPCGFDHLTRNPRGWLVPTDEYWRLWLQRPELALVEESCAAEQALHASLMDAPTRAVAPHELDAFEDDDARANHRLFLGFRDAVMSAGSLEAAYAGFFKAGSVQIPPLFLDLVVQALVCNLLDGVDGLDGAWQWRAAEMLFRRQRVRVQDGRVLSGDSDVLDMLNETGGLGAVGRLLMQSGAAIPEVNIEVLSDDNAARYLQSRAGNGRFNFVLDLTHEIQRELSHGLTLTMNRSQSGLKALALVLQKWVRHFHGVVVQVQPEARVDDEAWRWHVGLDVESTALLNDLYRGNEVAPERQQRLISLFRLTFDDPQDMQLDVRGKPVYLGLAMNTEGLLKIKPQNLLLNLPLARSI
ncbi:MAG: DUF6352 family protein [Hydrogenophaga sp.]|jgi:hypothetical protein|uniref:DUF6352 family protein n=1 Tax=Hydrogenophaga sp. TaxID=1904254 RepID=UPI0025C02F61|nr:DUF6352 family protein [Hydrogenophaga sp.]MDP1686949.1 DUF6352 family protein [Hydrogenophaga sp.]MDP1781737.1 DUF6352 family protein [Hydrogenophaga sp.]MDP2074170.1 DUF6352 family protein [Hydrogenophaga sp.]MDP3109874.1 DUF6352 family protein [Hydrogenophaga sp.]MDZ4129615.1 DUF6352 family protein [Hydrogenophaga sp.]